MKKLIASLLCATMVLSMAACGGTPAPSTATPAAPATPGAPATPADGAAPAHKEEIIIGAAADINTLDVQSQQDQINNIALKLTHENLVFFTNEGTFEPSLATSWEFTDDTHIVFKLAEGVTFSDGSPMTADDVKFTLDRGMTNMAASTLTGLLSTKVVDPLTVELTIDKYSNEFVQSLASLNVAILSKKAYDSGMEEPYLIGTGPYKLDEWVEGEYSRFKKVDNYWGEKDGVSETITFRPILEASSRVIALQNGEIDVCIDPPINELQYLEEDKNLAVFERAGSRLFYFAFNVEKAPWDNLKLRQAVACAIDRNAVLQAAVYGKGTPQTTILNRGLWGFYDEMPGFDYDVARAKTLMTESGVPAGLKTTITVANSGSYANVAQVIQANLKEIGIEVEIKTMEDATLKSSCAAGEQELYLWRWNEDSKVDFVYRDLFYTGSSSNYQHYSDPKADALIDNVLTEKDETKRLEFSKELQTKLVEDCPQVPLYIANLVIAYNKNLKGEYLFGGGNHDWRYAYIAQ